MSNLKRRLTNLWRRQTTAPNHSRPWPGQSPDRIFVTLREPTKISGAVLLPGRYAFRPLDPGAEHTPVQIFSEDQMRLVATVPAVSDN